MRYPKTPHCDPNIIIPKGWIVTIKIDGENSSIYYDGTFHIRSINSKSPSKDGRAKAWASMIAPILCAEGYHRLVFENCYDQHSIHYVKPFNPLHAFYQTILITKMVGDEETVIPYEESSTFCQNYGIATTPIVCIADGERTVSDYAQLINTKYQEGLVFRNPASFPLENLHQSIVKWVRRGHVQTDQHWRYDTSLQPNEVQYKDENLCEHLIHTKQ